MNLTPKKLRALIFLLIFVLGVVLTSVTLSVQKNATKRRFSTTVAQVVKNDESASKSSKNASSENSSPKYVNPESNKVGNDRQGNSKLHYNDTNSSVEDLDYKGIFEIDKLTDVPKEGVSLIFVYKPKVNSAKGYKEVLNDFIKKNNDKYKYRIINTEKSNVNQTKFMNFLTNEGKTSVASPPSIDDIYLIAVKDGKPVNFIYKTDGSYNSFNSSNILNIANSLSDKEESENNQ